MATDKVHLWIPEMNIQAYIRTVSQISYSFRFVSNIAMIKPSDSSE